MGREQSIDPPRTLLAGVATVDITGPDQPGSDDPLYAAIDATTINDPLYVKALALKSGDSVAVIITVDAVAIAQIGSIRDPYLEQVRAELARDPGIAPENVLVNASHCHGVVCEDIVQRTVQAVRAAWRDRVPVRVGAGRGHEDRIMENRRLRLKDGEEADVRHAYSMPPDEEVVAAGPVDPEIGVLRLDRLDGRTLAVVYHFACHPIQGVPSGGNTADITGFASRLIEDSADDGRTALFLQGCAGDINPVLYKDVDRPRDAESLGNLLGLSTVRALHDIPVRDDHRLVMRRERLRLPRADLRETLEALQAQQTRLLGELQGTTLDLKSFLSLTIRHGLFPEYPSYYSHHYLHEEQMGRPYLRRMDARNREELERYRRNVRIMEQLTRLQTNRALIQMHQKQYRAAGSDTLDVEVVGLRVGDFCLVAFPGEVSVEIGLDIKRRSPQPLTFVAGVSNGYIYYTPTEEQLRNRGGAQEDSDCLVAPGWQALFEDKALELLAGL